MGEGDDGRATQNPHSIKHRNPIYLKLSGAISEMMKGDLYCRGGLGGGSALTSMELRMSWATWWGWVELASPPTTLRTDGSHCTAGDYSDNGPTPGKARRKDFECFTVKQ